MTEPIQNAARVSSADRPVRHPRRGGSGRRVVILKVRADHAPSDRLTGERNGLEGGVLRRPDVAIEYVPAHRTHGWAGAGRWSR